MEITIAFNTLLRRLPDLRLADSPLQWQTTYGMRALQTLPVAWPQQRVAQIMRLTPSTQKGRLVEHPR